MITHCPVTSCDVSNVCNTFGPDLAGVRGKTVKQKLDMVATDCQDTTGLPGQIACNHPDSRCDVY